MGKVIGIVSLKGGVGKTSVVTALGAAISEFNKKVLLVDANFSAPNLGVHLNLINPEVTLHQVLNRTANMSDSIYELEHFDVVPSMIFHNLEINPLKLREKLKYHKQKYDTILLDSAPALNEEGLAPVLASDELFVVTTPDYSTLSTTLKFIKYIKQRGKNVDGIILNKVHNKDKGND